MAVGTVKYVDLPEDMQVLLADFFDAALPTPQIVPEAFAVWEVPISAFPECPIETHGGDSRDSAYAMEIPISEGLPIVLCGQTWLDGRHRVWKAKRVSAKSVYAIDIQTAGVIRIPGSNLGKLL